MDVKVRVSQRSNCRFLMLIIQLSRYGEIDIRTKKKGKRECLRGTFNGRPSQKLGKKPLHREADV